MMNVAWFKNPDHVAYCKEEEILPKLSRELGINDLAQRVEAFRKEPSPDCLLYTSPSPRDCS